MNFIEKIYLYLLIFIWKFKEMELKYERTNQELVMLKLRENPSSTTTQNRKGFDVKQIQSTETVEGMNWYELCCHIRAFMTGRILPLLRCNELTLHHNIDLTSWAACINQRFNQSVWGVNSNVN